MDTTVLSSWTWFVSRGSGIAAAILLVAVIISGIGHVTGWTFRFMEPVKAWLVHKWLSYMLLIMIAIHSGILLIEKFVSFSILDILVPFMNTYSNKTTLFGLQLSSFAIAAGIIAAYGIGYIVLTSLTVIDTKKRFWKRSHFISYIVFVLVSLHILLTGTDFKKGILRWLVISLTGAVLLAAIARTRRRSLLDSVNESQ